MPVLRNTPNMGGRSKNTASQINNSSHHNPTKRVICCGKTTRAIRTPSQIMIAHDVVILNTKISPDAPPADTSVRSAQGQDISQKCVSSRIKSSSTYS